MRSYSQYTLSDEPLSAVWQAGLRFRSGKAKKYVYDAFRLPAFVRAHGVTKVEVWGGLRTAPGATATIASREGRGKYTPLGSATLNSAGYFRKTFRVHELQQEDLPHHDRRPLAHAASQQLIAPGLASTAPKETQP